MSAGLLLSGAEGFALGFSLILAIGAQNAHVLRCGLLNRRVFLVCMTCALSDAALIAAGVSGVGALAGASPVFFRAAAWGGAAFLFVYGGLRLRAAVRPGAMTVGDESGGDGSGAGGAGGVGGSGSVRGILLTTLALTWLNPHVYLDTMLLVGSASARFGGWERAAFGLGAMVASFVFFFSLGYGARKLAPVFARPAAWRVLDLVVAAVMFAIAARLAVAGAEGI